MSTRFASLIILSCFQGRNSVVQSGGEKSPLFPLPFPSPSPLRPLPYNNALFGTLQSTTDYKVHSPFCYCNIVHFAPTSKQITYLESAKNADNDRISAHFMKWKKFSKILCYSRVIPCQINQRCTPHPLTRFFRKFVYINYMQNKE